MKKIIAICLSFIIAASATVTVFAAPANFWGSPSGKPSPEIISFKSSDPNSTVQLILTPYSDRNDLSDGQIALLEKAYDSIRNAKSLTELNAELADVVAKLEIDSKYLAVTNIFDIHYVGSDNQSQKFEIVLSVDELNNFVGLLHMNKDGVWELVSDAKIEQDGDHLVFSVDSFSPFAVVVDTTGESPKTGDSVMIISAIVLAVSVVALAAITVKRKKQIEQ
jgi:LPXTG-motif cell wall-anchored protein